MALFFAPLAATALGAAAMYLLDPDQGRRRRAMLRDRTLAQSRRAREFSRIAARDLSQRAQGTLVEIRRVVQHEPVPDGVLVQRVRAVLGRCSSRPGAIHVEARDGRVELHGNVLAAEHANVLAHARAVRGASDVADRLTVHESSEGVSALQGGPPAPAPRSDVMQARWAPGTRALVGGLGGLMVLYGLGRRDLRGMLAGAGGAALLVRSVANEPLASRFNSEPQNTRSATENTEDTENIEGERLL